MASGITAKLLHVDLSTRQTRTEEVPETVLRKHLGGGALAAHILLRDMPAGVDPLGPDNVDPQTGRPTTAKLAELGVESAAK